MDLSVSTTFGSLSTYVFPGGYDSTKLGLGPLMVQSNQAGNEGKWVGPMPIQLARPVESTATVPGAFPAAVTFSTQYDWIFLADTAGAAATRRFQLWRLDKTNLTGGNAFDFVGYITASIPSNGTQGTYTIRGQQVSYEKYVTGTVSTTNGSATVTGSGSTWSADRIFVGSRIGFGSTDPSQITKWYQISAVGSDTSITLTTNFGESNLSGSAYVIEDLRILFVATNGTTASNAGLFMIAGLQYADFAPGGTAISAAATTDKVKACFWLSDGNATSNSTNQTYGGIAIDTRTDWTHQNVYCLDAAAGQSRFQLNNFRAAMTVGGTTSGRDSTGSTWALNTGQEAVTGTAQQNHSLCLCTPGAGGGPRNGVKSLFWVTAQRIYSAAVANITSASTTFQSGSDAELPPGGTSTFPITSSLGSIAYDALADRFLSLMSSGGSGNRQYWTQYREDGGQWDRFFLPALQEQQGSAADSSITPVFFAAANASHAAILGGICYTAANASAATTNFLWAIPLSADWEYASSTNCCVVTPAYTTAQFSRFIAGLMNVVEVIGGKTGTNLGTEPSAVRMYYRTTGISDNSGSWNLLDYSGDMSSIAAGSQVQARLEYRMLTITGLPSRVTRVAFLGSPGSDSHFQFSYKNTDLVNKKFSFRYATAFGTTVPTLYIRLYDAISGALLVSDNTASPTGTFEKSTDGGTTWTAFNTTDRANETTYVRYTPTSLADNVNVQPMIALS